MNKKTKNTLTIVIGLIVGFILIYFLTKKIPIITIIDQFRHANMYSVIAFISVSVMMMLFQTLRWQVITKSEGMRIPFWNLFMYKIVGFGISFITPAAKVGGEPFRANLMKRHGVSFRKGLSTIMIDKLMDFSTIGILFGVAVVVAITTMSFPAIMKYLMIGIATFFAMAIFYLYYQLLHKKNFLLRVFKKLRLNRIKKIAPIENKLVDFEDTIRLFYLTKKKAFMKIIFWSGVNWLSMFLEYKFAISIFGISNISFPAIFLIITMMGVAYLFPIPLALGVLEAGQMSTFSALELNPAAGFGLSMIIRFRDLMWTFLSFIILGYYGVSLKKKLSDVKHKPKKKTKKKRKKEQEKNKKEMKKRKE